MSDPEPRSGELRLDARFDRGARALASPSCWSGAARAGPSAKVQKKMLSPAEVSEWWGVTRLWVYATRRRLGVRRIGTGTRPRLRFDPDEVAERLGEPRASGGRPA